MSDVKAKMHQIWFRLVYSAPPDPLAGFKGPTSKEMEGRERRERDVAPKLPDQTRPMFRLAIHLENVFLPTWCVTHISASCRLSSKVSFRMTLSDLAKYSMTWSPDSWASCFVSLSSIISLSIPFPGQSRLVFSDTFYCCFQKPFFSKNVSNPWSDASHSSHTHRTGSSRFFCCCYIHLELYPLTLDCAKTFSLSNATWKPICSNSPSPPVLHHQVPLRT